MHVLHRMRDASRLCFAELLLGCESLTSRLDVAVFHHWNCVHVSPSAPALLKLLGANERHCKGAKIVLPPDFPELRPSGSHVSLRA